MNPLVEEYMQKHGKKFSLYQFHFLHPLGDSSVVEVVAKNESQAWALANDIRKDVVNPGVTGVTLELINGKEV